MSTSDLARRAPDAQSIEQQQSRGLTFATVADMTGYSLPQIAMIRHNMALSMRVVPDEVPLYDIALFCHSCRSLGLDPLLKQAYWISRQGKGALQIGIDGYRALADRQGNYAGSSEPVFRGTIEWEHRGRKIVVPDYCQVVTWKIVAGQRCSFVGEARWTEYVPRANGAGAESDMWAKMPRNQLAKCAEAQSLRKGWPAQLGGLAYDVGADAADFSIEQVPTEPQRPPATAADHKRIFGADEDHTQYDLPPRPAAPPPPVQQGDPPPAAEKDDSAAAPARSGEPATDAELAENAALVEDARSLNVKGLGPLTAKPGWPGDRTRDATAELRARIRSRNNELDGENARASGQAEF